MKYLAIICSAAVLAFSSFFATQALANKGICVECELQIKEHKQSDDSELGKDLPDTDRSKLARKGSKGGNSNNNSQEQPFFFDDEKVDQSDETAWVQEFSGSCGKKLKGQKGGWKKKNYPPKYPKKEFSCVAKFSKKKLKKVGKSGFSFRKASQLCKKGEWIKEKSRNPAKKQACYACPKGYFVPRSSKHWNGKGERNKKAPTGNVCVRKDVKKTVRGKWTQRAL